MALHYGYGYVYGYVYGYGYGCGYGYGYSYNCGYGYGYVYSPMHLRRRHDPRKYCTDASRSCPLSHQTSYTSGICNSILEAVSGWI